MACRLFGAKLVSEQQWHIVTWTLKNTLQLNILWNSKVFIEEHAMENTICEMATIYISKMNISVG